MKYLVLLLMLIAFMPTVSAGLHEYQPLKTMMLFNKYVSIRSKWRFVVSLFKTWIRRVPVPFAMEVDVSNEEIKKLVEAQSKQWKDVIEPKLFELDKAVKASGSTAEVKAQIEKALADFGKLAEDGRAAVKKEMEKRLDELEIKMKAGQFGGIGPIDTAGSIVAKHESVLAYSGKQVPHLERAINIPVKSFRKDILGTAGSAGDLVIPLRMPGIVQTVPNQQLRIRDLLNVTPISTPLLQYVRQVFFGAESGSSGQLTGNANVVAEGDLKPKADLRFEEMQATATTIATWLAASRQILADAPVLRGFIDTQLLYALMLEEELQLLYGSGISPNLEGITLLATPFTPNSGETIIDGLRRMIAAVLAARFPATGFVVNPQDWVDVELLKDKNERYIIGDPNQVLGSRIWGLPVVQSESMLLQNALCGAFGMGATLYDREEANVQVSEQHADFFIRNLVAIRAEERVMLPIFRPGAFVYGNPKASS